MIDIDVGGFFDTLIDWMEKNWSGFFKLIKDVGGDTLDGLNSGLIFPPAWIMISFLAILAFFVVNPPSKKMKKIMIPLLVVVSAFIINLFIQHTVPELQISVPQQQKTEVAFFKIYNPSGDSVDLKYWQTTYSDETPTNTAKEYEIPLEGVIHSNQTVIVAENSNIYSNKYGELPDYTIDAGFPDVSIGDTVRVTTTTLAKTLTVFALLAILGILYYAGLKGVGFFSFASFFLIEIMGFWPETMETLTLIIISVIIALIIGMPVGIWASKKNAVEHIVRPILDFMQTLPPFVYLIPAVLFLGTGKVSGVIATLIFALPPAVRFTNLGIRQVPEEIKEAAASFGSTPRQMLFKAEIPVAMPTILAGINQTIMLALSMVVIAGLIGAGGLGGLVIKAIQQLETGLGFEAGISIVILAIYLDRITQAMAGKSETK